MKKVKKSAFRGKWVALVSRSKSETEGIGDSCGTMMYGLKMVELTKRQKALLEVAEFKM